MKLDALPIGGTLQIRDYEPREEFESNGGPARARPVRAAAGARADQAL